MLLSIQYGSQSTNSVFSNEFSQKSIVSDQSSLYPYNYYKYYNRIISFDGQNWDSNLNLTSFLSGNGTVENLFILANFSYSFSYIRDETILLDIQHGNNIILYNCSFHGVDDNTYNWIAILFRSSTNITIANCSFQMFRGDSIIMEDVNDTIIRSCSFLYNHYRCITMNYCNRIKVFNNTLQLGGGFSFTASNDVKIYSNSFYNVPGAAIDTYWQCERCIISNNTILQCDEGIFLGGARFSSKDSAPEYHGLNNSIVSGNFIENCIDSAIVISFAQNVTTSLNILQNCGEMGIKMRECFNSTIEFNQFQSIRHYGINMTKSINIIIRNNIFEGIQKANINSDTPYSGDQTNRPTNKINGDFDLLMVISSATIGILVISHPGFQRKKQK